MERQADAGARRRKQGKAIPKSQLKREGPKMVWMAELILRPMVYLLVAILVASISQAAPPSEPAEKPGVWTLPPLLAAIPLKEARGDDALRKLLKSRYNEAVSEAKEYYDIRRRGEGHFAQDQDGFYRMWQRIVSAGLELCNTPAEKVKFLTEYAEVTKKVEKEEQARVEAQRNPMGVLNRARYERMDAEIQLLRARRETAAGKDK